VVPPATKSAVTVDKVTVTDAGNGFYKIVVSGTMTLGKDDTWVGFKFWLANPSQLAIPPIVTQYSQPQPGFTTGYSYYTISNIKGKWTANASILFTTGGKATTATDSKAFTVP
jgi:hypothetical protein